MMELLRLSESRAALVGGVAVDTLCVGTLVLSMLQPTMFAQGHSGVIVLTALAITSPVLASAGVIISFVIANRFEVEERARRILMSATVLHGGVQLSTVVAMMCGNGPSSVAAYFLMVWLLTAAMALSFLPLFWVARKLRKPLTAVSLDELPPTAKL